MLSPFNSCDRNEEKGGPSTSSSTRTVLYYSASASSSSCSERLLLLPFPSFYFVRIDRASLVVVFFVYASAPRLYLFFFNSGPFLYDFNGQDLLSVSEFDGSPPFLFFFVFFVLVPARFSFLLRLLSLQFQRTGSLSVPESDSSHPLLFFFFVVVRSQ